MKRASDTVLCDILGKLRLGECDEEVTKVLNERLQEQDLDSVELDRTVVICSTRKECEEINDACIEDEVDDE